MANHDLQSTELESFKSQIRGKEVVVIGLGVSNVPLIKFLHKHGAVITACDKKTESDLGEVHQELRGLEIKFSLGEDYLKNIDKPLIFKTPGMYFDSFPEFISAERNGSVITSEMELFMHLCPATIIGVTGSDGKTTTTTLIHKMLEEQGTCRAYIGGNIGRSLIEDVEEMQPNDKVVLELSSFQLHRMTDSPQIAVITNITPNHLDVHKDMVDYVDAKKNIFRYQAGTPVRILSRQNGETESQYPRTDGQTTSRLVLNYDNEITRSFAAEAKGDVMFFSREHVLDNGPTVVRPAVGGVYLAEDGTIRACCEQYGDVEVMHVSDILLSGMHNVENYMAAIAAVWECDFKAIRRVAKSFTGVEHRIEFVRELDGVKYYNDSIASSPTRTHAAFNAFNSQSAGDKKLILIAGGYDKNIPFDGFGMEICRHVKILLLMGKTAPKILKAVKSAPEFDESNLIVINCTDLGGCVKTAREMAKGGDVVILSPGCASFDMFTSFEERGRQFKKLVEEL